MSELETADLETEAATSDVPVTEPQSLDSLIDSALDDESPQAVAEAPKPGVDRGDGRDATGKFATKAEQAAAEAAAQATGTRPAEVAAAPGAATPFQYRSFGKNHAVEGSTLDAQGNAVIPAAKIPELREAFNALHQRQATFVPSMRRLESENAQLRAQAESKGQSETRAGQLLEMLERLVSIADPADRVSKIYEFTEAYPGLKQQAEVAYLKQELERAKTPQQQQHDTAQQQPATAMSPEAMVAQTKDTIDEAKIHYPALSESDWQQIEHESSDAPFAFFRLATAEDAKWGVQPGQLVFDTMKLKARIAKVTDAAKEAAELRAAEHKRVELATSNARRTQATVNAPPVAGGTHAPPKGANRPKPKSTEDRIDAALEDDD